MEIDIRSDQTSLMCTVFKNGEVLGYLAIDSFVAGRACGGLRFLPDVSQQEVIDLARCMTLKFGFLGLSQGGSKTGVRADPEAPQEERWSKLAEFGKAIAPWLRTRMYVPGTDMGTKVEDLRYMLRAAGVRLKARELRGSSSGDYTAMTVFGSVREGARRLGINLKGVSAAIEGFGSVGSYLALLLDRVGVKVVAVSTLHGAIYNPQGLEVSRLLQLRKQAGSRLVELYGDAQKISLEDLLELPVELQCPCARQFRFNESNIKRVQARLISPGANNPITDEAEKIFRQGGGLVIPSFVANCGGTLGATMEFAGWKHDAIGDFIAEFFEPSLARILDEAERKQEQPTVTATRQALARFVRVQQQARSPSIQSKLFSSGLELYRRGLIPGALTARLSYSYFRRCLE